MMYKITKKSSKDDTTYSFFYYICNEEITIDINNSKQEGDKTMKPKPKMHHQEDYELDNIYNDENARYDSSSNSVIWYS